VLVEDPPGADWGTSSCKQRTLLGAGVAYEHMFDRRRWSENLNAEQLRAVEHGDAPLLVVAGAGTGKTSTLAARVARLLEDGAVPERTCLLTFSRRAAAEMLTRAGRTAGSVRAAQVVGGTFHAVSQRLLRHHGHLLGLDPGFSVLDAGEATELMGLVRHDLGLDRVKGSRFARKETLVAILSQVANSQVRLSDVVARSFPWCGEDLAAMREVFGAYTARKRAQQLCDFDDLLLLVQALGASAAGGRALGGLFDHVLVDEYQDVNSLQAGLVDVLRPGGHGVTAVGDDAQAIYGFRAATTVALREFEVRYPGAEVIRLEHNYRSTPPILAVANQVMAEASTGFAKTLWSERAGRRRPMLRTCADEATQAEVVCDSVLAHREEGVALRCQAVLFRAGHHAAVLELALGRRRIPYVKYGGLRFIEAAHVKDLLAILRLLDNPWDELAWFRVLQLLEGVGAATARRMMDQLGVRRAEQGRPAAIERPDIERRAAERLAAVEYRTAERPAAERPAAASSCALDQAIADPALSPVARLLAAAPSAPAAARDELAGLRAALGECTGAGPDGAGPPPVGAQVERVLAWLDPVVVRRYDAPAARCGDLERLVEVAAAAPSRNRFVADLTLDPPISTGDLAGPPSLDDDWLVLSTVHSAKGGEWDVVHVIHAADGMFPSDLSTGDAEAVAEERRLFYVALTRARDVLEVSAPLRYHHHQRRLDDRHSYAPVSRFLSPAVVSLMEPCHAGPPDGHTFVGHEHPGGDIDPGVQAAGVAAVDALLAELWS